MSGADRASDRDLLSCPERDAMVASLLGITPERLRTIRRVHDKRTASTKPAGGAPWWQCVDQLDDDALFAAFRNREARARRIGGRAGVASPVERRRRRSPGRR